MRELPVREHHVTANYPLEICKGSDVSTHHNLPIGWMQRSATLPSPETDLGHEWVHIRSTAADRPPAAIAQVGHTQFNGVTRQIPGTQHSDERRCDASYINGFSGFRSLFGLSIPLGLFSGEPIPSLKDEPKWMKLSTAVSSLFKQQSVSVSV